MKKKMFIVGVFLFTGISFLSGCGDKKAELLDKPLSRQEFQVGTYVSIKIYDKDKEKALDKVFTLVQDLEEKIEVNEEGVSEVDLINENSGVAPVKVSKEVFDLISEAKEYAEQTRGMYEPAIGAITSLWHIGFSDAKKPENEEITPLLDKLSYQDIELDDTDMSVFLKKKGMKLDLGGIGKAFIAEKVMTSLKNDGVTTAILDFGGHVFVIGENPKTEDGKWIVSMQDPSKETSTGQDNSQTSVGKLSGGSGDYITTSMYERYLVIGDKVYSHLMDPATGYPYDNDLLAVMISGEDYVRDDALSNALYDMGLEKGLAYANEQGDIKALFITNDKKVYLTDNLKENFTLNKKSEFQLGK
ncbi:thiamine biosynthesis lipoprotein [Pilibacter termitis]|uniref:FAD:protein FMN transferase n=1 Tax=Pilibacter termitis TaxID=263852 RepID=A0A1T4Q9I7_9ENTE|nr:FAD:protein FMN transferase [Pilibacter termitis]SKA00306.1 thiamine biosynthesis lipoprotein [Pilibacter termitis]